MPGRAQNAPLAGTVITNRASVSYIDAASGLAATVQTNTVSAVVQAVEGLDLTADQTRLVPAGATVTLAHSLLNTGNVATNYSFAFANVGGDAYDLANLRLFVDSNGNGIADSGEPQIAPGQTFLLAPGQRLNVVLIGAVPAGTPPDAIARVTISATAAGGLVDTNTDTIRVVAGVSLAINKAVEPDTARPGDLLNYGLTLISRGTTAPQPIGVAVDGAARDLFLVRDTIPANTTFVDWVSTPPDAIRLYHVAGSAFDFYVSARPADSARIDAIAIGFTDYGSPNRSIQLNFSVRVGANATGEILNIAQARYRNAAGTGVVAVQADSNIVRTPLPRLAPTISFFTGPTYTSPATSTNVGQPLYVQALAAACNADSTRVEQAFITISSGATGDVERRIAVETGANTGVFSLQVPLPTRDVASNPAVSNNGFLETTPRDTVAALIQSCDGQNASAQIVVSPFGVVFDSRTNSPIAGARVSLLDANNNVVATSTTGADGVFQFPAAAPGTYRLLIQPPANYTFPSRVPPGALPADRVINPTGSYGQPFILSGGVVAFDVPLDGTAPGGLFLQKEASQTVIGITDVLDYRITVNNRSGVVQNNITISDDLPRGFAYIRGSARRVAAGTSTSLADPIGAPGPRLAFSVGSLAPDEQFVLLYRVRIGAGALSGRATNRAIATATTAFGPTSSNTATASVQVQPGVFNGRGIIIGKVYVDSNHNRVQDKGELGIPGVRLYLENGTYAITDSEGKYSVYGLSPRTHVVKLDTTTMPAGSRLVPLNIRHAGAGDSSFADLTAGELQKVNFAIEDATPAVLKQIAARRAVAERAVDETALAGAALTPESGERSARESRGLPSSGVIAAPTNSGGFAAPNGTIALPSNPNSSALGNDTSRTSIVGATSGSTLSSDALKGEGVGAATKTTNPTTSPIAPANPADATSPAVVVGSIPLPQATTETAPGITFKGEESGAVPPLVGSSAQSSTPLENTTALVAPGSRGLVLSPSTLHGGLPVANTTEDGVRSNSTVLPDVSETQTVVSTQNGNALLDNVRNAGENVVEGANKQPQQEPIGAGNSNLPGAPVRLAPTVNWDKILPTLNSELGFYDLRDGDVLVIDQANVRIKGTAGARFELRANGKLVSDKQIGARSTNAEVEAREYIGVRLNSGPNVLEVTQFDGAGNARGRKSITVVAPGDLGRLVLRAPKNAYADGRTPITVTVSLQDKDGVPISTRTPLTLESSLGSWQVIDINPVEPGVQVFIEGGRADFALAPPLETGDALVRITSGVLGAQARLSFLPDLRPLLGVGLLESQLALFKVNRVRSNSSTLFDQQLRSLASSGNTDVGGRGAAFFKGRVKGSMLLTMRYDTQRDADDERLFRDIQPDEYYPIYGDSSLKGFEAQSTSRLYVRVDKNKSYVLYGDYTTPSQNLARSLGEYNRSLTGLKFHHETDRFSFNTFAANDSARRVVVELAAKGTSGPYLLGGLVSRQSEQIEIITRDRNQPSVILSVVPQTRFSDYTLDGLTDGILFRAPIPSRDANLNPIFIRVTYEVETGGPNFFVGGFDGQLRLTNKLAVGGSFVSDRDIADPFRLMSVNAAYQFGANTIALAEAAFTDRRSVGSDRATRFELLHESNRLQARAFVGKAGTNFDNPSSLLTRGRTEAALRTTYALSPRTRLIAEAIKTKDDLNGGTRTGAQVAVEQAISNTARVELGIRRAKESGGILAGTGSTVDFTSVRARLSSQVPRVPNATIFTEYERAFGGGNRQALSLGGQYQINDRSRVYFAHELISSLQGQYALNDVSDHNSTIFGLDTDYMRNGHLFSEYRVRDAIDGRSAEAAIGLRNLWTIGRGVRLGTSFERVKPLSGVAGLAGSEGTAASLALEYVPNDDFKITGRLEGRDSAGGNSYLSTLGLAYKVSPAWTVLGRGILSQTGAAAVGTRGTSQQRFQIGTAYRPVDNDRFNALAKYEYRGGEDLTGFTNDIRRKVHILSSDFNYQPNRATQMRLHYAMKMASTGSFGQSDSASAHLISTRLTREFGRRYELGLFAGMLFDGSGGNGRQYGLGLEASRLITRDLMLSLGYNILGFRDEDLSLDNSTTKGPYLRIRWKFDEDLFGGLLRSTDRLERAVAPDSATGLPAALPTGNSPASLDALPVVAVDGAANSAVAGAAASDILTDEEAAALDAKEKADAKTATP